MRYLTPLFTRTAILLYVSLSFNAAMYYGLLINRANLQVSVCDKVEKAMAEYNENHELENVLIKE